MSFHSIVYKGAFNSVIPSPKALDRVCSGYAMASAACGFVVSSLGYLTLSSIASMCEKVSKMGFNVLNEVVSNSTKQSLLGRSSQVVQFSGPVARFCKELNTSGLKALGHLLPINASHLLSSGCPTVQPYSEQVSQVSGLAVTFCKELNTSGLGALAHLLPKNVTQLLVNSCNTVEPYSEQVRQFSESVVKSCQELNSSHLEPIVDLVPKNITQLFSDGCRHLGLYPEQIEAFFSGVQNTEYAAFETIGSLELKQTILNGCKFADAIHPYLLFSMVITGTVTVYYAYRCCRPVREHVEKVD